MKRNGTSISLKPNTEHTDTRPIETASHSIAINVATDFIVLVSTIKHPTANKECLFNTIIHIRNCLHSRRHFHR